MITDEQAIRDLIATWLRATKVGDNETVLALMAEDVVFLQPGQSPMRGRTAFAQAQQGTKNFDIDSSADIQEIQIFGDWAYCWNYLKVTATPRDGGAAVKRAGSVLTLLKKEDGRWVIFRDANLLSKVDQ